MKHNNACWQSVLRSVRCVWRQINANLNIEYINKNSWFNYYCNNRYIIHMERLLNSKPFVCFLCVLYAPSAFVHKNIANLYYIHSYFHSHSHSQSTYQLFKYNCSMESRETHWSINEEEKSATHFHSSNPYIERAMRTHPPKCKL